MGVKLLIEDGLHKHTGQDSGLHCKHCLKFQLLHNFFYFILFYFYSVAPSNFSPVFVLFATLDSLHAQGNSGSCVL